MPNVSDFYLDHVTGKAYFEMDDGSNKVKDLNTLVAIDDSSVTGIYNRITSIANLRLSGDANITEVMVTGYASENDGGEGLFRVDASDITSSDNAGSIIVDTLGRRWKRTNTKTVTARQFGAIPDEISGGSFDNASALNSAFAWALSQNTGVIVDLESYTYSCLTPPVIGVPSSAATPNQAQPITVRGDSTQRQAGKRGAKIKVTSTSIGQHSSLLRIDGTQAIAWLTLQNFALETNQITATISAQSPSSNTIIITGADVKGFTTGSPVYFTGGGGGTEISRAGSSYYYLRKVAGTDTFQIATSPANAAGGTVITLSTAWTGSTTLTAVEGGATSGVLFDGTRFTASRLYGLRVKYADNAYNIQAVGDTANGEFASFEKCEGISCKRFFLMSPNTATGQALETVFYDCSANPRLQDAVAVFEYGGDTSRGYGVTSVNTNASVTPIPVNGGEYRPKIVFIKDNGTSDSNTFIGGRVENITTFYEGTNDSWEQRTHVSGVTFASIASTNTEPFVVTSGAGVPGAGSMVTADHCFFYSPSGTWAKTNCLYNFDFTNTSTTAFLFDRCAFNFNRRRLTQGTNSSSIEFKDCTQKYTNTANASMTIKRFSEKLSGSVLHPLSNRGSNHTINNPPGVPSNLLQYPNFGDTTGATITAPSPWIHTGAGSFNRLDMYNDVATPNCKRIRLEPSSGVKQVLSVTPTEGTPFYYQANAWVIFMATNSDRIRIALENETTGEIYDEVLLGAQPSNQHSSAITLTAHPRATAAGQFYRLVIENKGTVNVNQLLMNWQLASGKPSAVYILPRTNGTTEEHQTVWDANIDTLRAFSRQALPYKTDSYGQSAQLRDIYSDVYLSQTTEKLTYAAGVSQAQGLRWYVVPRVTMSAAMPSTGSYTAGDYVQKSTWVEAGSVASKYVIKGWMRITTGSGHVAGTDWLEDRALTGN